MYALLFASSALLGLDTHGQPPAQSAHELDAVVVTARPMDPPADLGRTFRRLTETPGAVSLVPREAYAQREALALDDMLRDTPGVYAQRRFGGDVRISIRGSGLGASHHNRGVLIAQDGIPLNEADGFGDSQLIDPLLTRHMEVHRGGNALRFGGAMLGGAINTVTPNGATAGFTAQIRVDGGAYGLARQNVQLAGIHGDWDVFLAGTNQRQQGWRAQSQQNLQFGALNIGRRFGEDRELRLVVNGASLHQEMPGPLTLAELAADPRQASPAYYAGDYGRHQRAVRGALQARWRFGPDLVLEGAAYAAWKELDHPIFQVIDQESRNYGLSARLDWRGEIAGIRADAVLGAWLRSGDIDSRVYLSHAGARGALQSVAYPNAAAADVFAEARLWMREDLALVAGGAWGAARRDYRSVALPGRPGTSDFRAEKTYDWLAPRVGVLWEPREDWQVFGNLTMSAEAPNFAAMSPDNTGFAPIEAQTAWTAEAGARGRVGRFAIDLAIYRSWLRNELLLHADDPTRPTQTFNARGTLHQGLELGLDWQVGPRVRVRQTYAWADFRFVDDPRYGDNRLPVQPEHLYRAELRYDHPGGWFLAPSVEASPTGPWIDFHNTARAPGYVVWNLNAGWRVTRDVAVFIDIRNLADEAYVSNVQPAVTATAGPAGYYWPGDGRAVYAGVTYAF